jgi:hypothetical protein
LPAISSKLLLFCTPLAMHCMLPLAMPADVASYSAAGAVPFPHAMMRQVNSLVCRLPALDNPQFKK